MNIFCTIRTFQRLKLLVLLEIFNFFFFLGKVFHAFNSYLPVVLSATTFPPSCSKYSSEFKKNPSSQLISSNLFPLKKKKAYFNFQMFDTVGIFSHQYNLFISFILFARSHMIINATNSPSQVFTLVCVEWNVQSESEWQCWEELWNHLWVFSLLPWLTVHITLLIFTSFLP